MKNKLFYTTGLIIGSTLMLTSCKDDSVIKVQLDYTINTNHTGLYVAIENGYFEDEGLKVEVVESGQTDPLLALATNKIDYAFSYQENITTARTSDDKLPVIAIGAVLQENTSGFAYKKSLNITDFSDFEGKRYGTWGQVLEQKIVESICEDTNTDFSKITLQTLTNGGLNSLGEEADLIWAFYGWDMALATHNDTLDDYEFKYLQDYNSKLDFYTPLIATNESQDEETNEKFMKAIAKGYKYAVDSTDSAAEILHKYAPEYELDFIKISLNYLKDYFIEDDEVFGEMDESKWETFSNWMYSNGVTTILLDHNKAFTNEYVK